MRSRSITTLITPTRWDCWRRYHVWINRVVIVCYQSMASRLIRHVWTKVARFVPAAALLSTAVLERFPFLRMLAMHTLPLAGAKAKFET